MAEAWLIGTATVTGLLALFAAYCVVIARLTNHLWRRMMPWRRTAFLRWYVANERGRRARERLD